MAPVSRRRFLEESLLIAAAAGTLPGAALAASAADPEPARRIGSKKTLRIAVVGLRGRGRGHIGTYKNIDGAEVVALVDPESDEAIVKTAQRSAPNARYVRDLREVLEADDIDAVSIATPNHWHALGATWALRAGKHVYVEKPLSHSLREGDEVVRAAAETGLVCQHGTQARSYSATREAIAWLRSGALGRVHTARGLCYKRRHSIGKVDSDQPIPKSLDYDLWTGPARMEPLRRKNLHYDWHWVYNTGDGDIGNQGVHQMDLARWGLGANGFPTAIQSVGGRLGYDDDGNTANTQVSSYTFGDARAIFEVRGLGTPHAPKARGGVGVVWIAEEGYLVSVSYNNLIAFDKDGNELRRFTGGDDNQHFRNWVEAALAEDPSMLNAQPIEGHRSSGMCQLGNLSYRLGAEQGLGERRPLSATDAPFGEGEDPGNEAFGRMRKHLAVNGVEGDVEYVTGPVLRFDPSTELFHGDHAAAAEELAAGHHREGYTFDAVG